MNTLIEEAIKQAAQEKKYQGKYIALKKNGEIVAFSRNPSKTAKRGVKNGAVINVHISKYKYYIYSAA